jgi:hypothetical protein
MRLWTLHPKYLDARGLVALWREFGCSGDNAARDTETVSESNFGN